MSENDIDENLLLDKFITIRISEEINKNIDIILLKNKERWSNKTHFIRCAIINYIDFLNK